MRDKSRSRAVRVFLLCHHSSFWDKQGPAQLQGCCKATRKNEPSYLPTECSNGAEIRLHRRASHSAAGRPSGAKEKDSRTVEMRRLCVHGLLQQTEQRENSTRHIAAQSERAKMFQDRLSPFSACLRGTHSIMRRIWADTSHSRSIAGVEEEEEREEEGGMNNSTSQCCSALTSCVLWGGEASRQQQQAAPPHMTARGYSIQGTSIFPRTGHHFREQQ